MRANRNSVAITAALLAAIAAPAAAQNQADYPNHPVMLIVPYAAGGVADVGMRILSEKLSSRLNQQFVIENRPGAAGIVAAQTGALFKSLPYNILTDFDSVSTAAFFDILIVTRAGSPLHSVQDVIQAARANPGKLNIATINPGSTQNLAAELFTSTAGIKAAIVPFRTSPDMDTAVMRGDVDVAFEFYAALSGLLADKKIVALASTGAKRTAYLPDVPTVMESGIEGYDVASWNGISVPRGTPKAVIATLNQAMKDVIPRPEVQAKSSRMGMAMRWSTPADMTARMQADIAKWGAVIEKAGIAKRD
jgi:tripartite-type tricarboxylate transporter receptor subunit TctC